MKIRKLIVNGVPLLVFFTLLATNIFVLVVFIFLIFVKQNICPVSEPNKLILYTEFAVCSLALIFAYTLLPIKRSRKKH